MEGGGESDTMKSTKNKSTVLHLVNSKTGWGKPALRAEFFMDCKPQCDGMTKSQHNLEMD